MSSMLDAEPSASRSGSVAAVLGTVTLHGLIVLGASLLGLRGVAELRKALPVTEMVEIELPAPPPTPATPEPPPAARAPAPAAPQPPTPASEPPPSAAQAGQILDSSGEVTDFGDSFVTGTGDQFAGGTTDANGTSKVAMRDTSARAGGAGSGTAAPAPAPDLSRPPELDGNRTWQCPFPVEADDAGVDHAVVALHIDIGADGAVLGVTTLADPGSGFGRSAERCALRKRFKAGLDRTGRPVAKVLKVNVRFDR